MGCLSARKSGVFGVIGVDLYDKGSCEENDLKLFAIFRILLILDILRDMNDVFNNSYFDNKV